MGKLGSALAKGIFRRARHTKSEPTGTRPISLLRQQWQLIATAARDQRLILDALLLGIVGAISAQAFQLLLNLARHFFLEVLAGYSPPGLPDEGGVLAQVIGSHGLALIPVAATLGGLITGVLVFTLAPEAEGHGTDEVINAFHRKNGAIRPRVPFVKLFASAATIGSGGSAGREGPTALIAAGIGSIYGKRGRRSDYEVRLLALIGMAAGLSAIFRSPLGAAVFAVEVLYGEMEFESGALLYTMLSAVVAYAFNGLFIGFHPLFRVPSALAPQGSADYLYYAVLGVASGTIATAVPLSFYLLRTGFHHLPIPRVFKPVLGAFLVGLIGTVFPQVLMGGYGWIQAILGKLTAGLMLILMVTKLMAFSLTIGSGGSGGVFAPTLYVGAMAGGLVATVVGQPAAAFVVVGMAAVFAGAAPVPLAAMLMVTEMTGGYHMLVPAALAVMLSYLVQGILSRPLPYRTLYREQVSGRVQSPAHHAEHLQIAIDLLRQQRLPIRVPIGRLELVSLLSSGVPVGMPDGRTIRIGVVRPDSHCIGQPVSSGCLAAPDGEVEVLRIWRGSQRVWPGRDAHFEPGDRILMITSEAGWTKLTRDLDPLPSRE